MELLMPISALFALTGFAVALMGISRFKAVKSGKVKAGYFKIYINKVNAPAIPEKLVRIGRHYQNLLEFPIFFYMTCIIAMHFNQEAAVVSWAWLFVFARISQSVIHLTINHVFFRMLSFALGIVAVIGMWLTLIGKLYL